MDLRAGASAQPVSWDRHRCWTWRKPQGYAFACALRSVPVSLTEAASAASCFPLVFQTTSNGPVLQALLRRAARGRSVFIGQDGQWQASWLLPRLAVWPFDLVETSAGGHALALHETRDCVFDGPGGTPIFAAGDAATLSPQTARMAAILKAQAEALPATIRAAMALRDHGLLTPLDGDASIVTVDPIAAADLDEAAVLVLHRAGALALLHAALISHAHLPWMEKAEQRLAALPVTAPQIMPARISAVTGSSFLAAIAAETPDDDALLPFSGRTQP